LKWQAASAQWQKKPGKLAGKVRAGGRNAAIYAQNGQNSSKNAAAADYWLKRGASI